MTAPYAKPLVTYVARINLSDGTLANDGKLAIVGVVFAHGYDKKTAELIASKKYRASLPQISLLEWENASEGERREAVAAESRALIRLL